MSKQHRLLTILLALVLCVSMMFSLIACTPTEEEKDEPTDSGKIIANGNFELTSSTTFPKTPSSWTGATGSTATDNETPNDEKSISNGVVSVNETDYDKNKKKWGKLANPGQVGTDNNILMINNKVKTSYKYTSSSFSLSANKYYLLTAYVRTDKLDVDADGGAFIGLTGDTYKFFKIPDTSGTWQKVEYYFKSSNISSNSVSIWASLGSKGKTDGMLAKGYAFYDNITVTEMKDDASNTAAMQYDNVIEDSTKRIFKSDMTLPDANFENISGSKAPYSPSLWTGSAGTGTDGSAPTGNDYLEKGIVDTANPTEFMPEGIKASGGDSFMLALNNKQRTAYGYRSDKRIRFESNKYYKLSIDVHTVLGTNNADDTGAFIRLKSGTGADEVVVEIPAIKTDSKWETASFFIKTDEMRHKDFYLEVFLGQGGKNDAKLVEGQAFFDNIKLEKITDTAYDNAPDDKLNVKKSINTSVSENIIANANTDSNFFGRDELAYKDLNNINRGNPLANVPLAETGWNNSLYGAYPGKPNDGAANVVIIKNNTPAVNIYKFSNNLTISPNSYYRMGVWVKTADIPKDLGVTVSLYSYDKNAVNTATEAEKVSKLISFDNINTEQIKNNLTSSYNEYVELVFYIEGSLLSTFSNNDKEVFMQVALGSGHNFESAKHTRGTVYLASFTMHKVAYTDYSSETGDYLKKHSFKASAYGVANANFDDINKQATEKLYGDLKFNEDGTLYNQFGLPTSWTHADESFLKNQLNAGIINVNTTKDAGMSNPLLDRINQSTTSPVVFNDAFYSGFQKEYKGDATLNNIKNPNLLVINTKSPSGGESLTESVRPSVCGCVHQACIDIGYCDGKKCNALDPACLCAHHNYNGTVKPWGFTSPSMSLTAQSYYSISVWAYVVDGEATISLKSSTKETPKRILVDEANGWQKLDFYVETGFETLSVNLELYLGNMANANIPTSGTVFFDMPSIAKVDKDIYDAAKKEADGSIKSLQTVSYSLLTFDNVTKNESTLDTPVSWTGAHRDEDAPKEEKDVISGVYNINHGNSDWFGKDDKQTISMEVLNKIYTGDNENILVINNTVSGEFAYTYTLPGSLTSKSFYKVSIDILTYGLSKDQTANINLKLENSTYEFAKDTAKGVNVNTSSYADDGSETVGWRTYTYYISTPEKNNISNVNISIGLGKKDKANYVAGFVFSDNLNITKIDSDEFPAEETPEGNTEDMYNKAITHRIAFTDEDVNKKEEEEVKKNNEFLWLYITSGIVGGLVVLAAAVFVYKKFIKKHIRVRGKVKSKPASYNKQTPTTSPKKNDKPSDSFKDKK